MALSSKQIKYLFASGIFKSRTPTGAGRAVSSFVRTRVSRPKKAKKTKFKLQFNPETVEKFVKLYKGLTKKR